MLLKDNLVGLYSTNFRSLVMNQVLFCAGVDDAPGLDTTLVRLSLRQ